MGKGVMKVKHESLKYDSLLLLASLIWGTAFVAQRIGMEHITPFYFNGIRFLLGALLMVLGMIISQVFSARRSVHPAIGT